MPEVHNPLSLAWWDVRMHRLGWSPFGMRGSTSIKFERDGWALRIYRAVHQRSINFRLYRKGEVSIDYSNGEVVDIGHLTDVWIEQRNPGDPVPEIDGIYLTLKAVTAPELLPTLVSVPFASQLVKFWGRS